MRSDDAVDPDLGHDGEQRGHRRTGRRISAWQPEIGRQQGCFQTKHDQQDQSRCAGQADTVPVQLRHLDGHVGHVQSARHCIKHGQANQKQTGARQIEHHVMQAHAQTLAALAMQQEHIGRNQQDLKKHKQVEEVPGHEGADQAHQLELKDGVEVAPSAVPAAIGVPKHRQGDGIGQQDHQRREPVEHQHNAKGCRPLAEAIGHRRAIEGSPHHADRHGCAQEHRAQAQATAPTQGSVLVPAALLGHSALVAHQQEQHGADGGQQHRKHRRVLHPEGPHRLAHEEALWSSGW